MIHTYSPTIRRKEMEAVLTCMVDEKIGPGDMNTKMIQTAKELMGFDGAVALRSPAIAFEYIFKALDFPKDGCVIFSALAAAAVLWHFCPLWWAACISGAYCGKTWIQGCFC